MARTRDLAHPQVTLLTHDRQRQSHNGVVALELERMCGFGDVFNGHALGFELDLRAQVARFKAAAAPCATDAMHPVLVALTYHASGSRPKNAKSVSGNLGTAVDTAAIGLEAHLRRARRCELI